MSMRDYRNQWMSSPYGSAYNHSWGNHTLQDFEHKWDNLQDSIEDLIDQQQCPPEEECQSDTMAYRGFY